MTPQRSYYWLGVPYATAGIAFLVWAIARAEWTWAVLGLLPLAGAAWVLGHWSATVAPRLLWARGDMLFVAALVLAPATTAPAIGALFGAGLGFDERDSDDLKPGRVLLNAGALGSSWGSAGLVYGVLQPEPGGPSLQLVAAIGIDYVTHLATNTLLLMPAFALVFGSAYAWSAPLSMALLGPQAGALAMALACVASVTAVAGPAYLPVATVAGAVIVAIPVTNANIGRRRKDVAASVIRAVNVDYLRRPAAEHERSVTLAREISLRLALSGEEAEQVRYLAALFAVTDHYAPTIPRSVEQRLSGESAESSLWPLIAGLPLEDLGSSGLIEAARAVAICSTMVGEPDRTSVSSRDQLRRALKAHGVPDSIQTALLNDAPGATHKNIMAFDADSKLGAYLRRRSLRRT